MAETINGQQIGIFTLLIGHAVTRIIHDGLSLAVVCLQYITQPINGVVHFAERGIGGEADMILGYAECLLTVNFKYLAIITGKRHRLFVLVVFVGYNHNEGLVICLTVDGNFSIDALCLGSACTKHNTHYI